MNNLLIKKLSDNKNAPMDLLLTADPSREMIKSYLKDAEVYIASLNNVVVGVYVLIKNAPEIVELKNIAVNEKFQKQGFGKKLVLDAIEKARKAGMIRIEVGTGNSSTHQLALYQKCGFKIVGVNTGFFTRTYPKKIIENGVVCADLIELAIDF